MYNKMKEKNTIGHTKTRDKIKLKEIKILF